MIIPHFGRWPSIHETAFVAPSCDIIGDVKIGAYSSLWFQCVVRGDVNSIVIGDHTNIQDSSTLHVTRKKFPLKVGNEVTVGHRVMLHGCTIGNRVLVGMGSIIMDGAQVGDQCMIGAGSLVTQGKVIPSGSLVLGSPAKVVRPLKEEELKFMVQSAKNYVETAEEYRSLTRGPVRLGEDNQDLEELGEAEEESI